MTDARGCIPPDDRINLRMENRPNLLRGSLNQCAKSQAMMVLTKPRLFSDIRH